MQSGAGRCNQELVEAIRSWWMQSGAGGCNLELADAIFFICIMCSRFFGDAIGCCLQLPIMLCDTKHLVLHTSIVVCMAYYYIYIYIIIVLRQ